MTDVVARLGAALADRYVIERELGAGGMATVYLAHDVRHDRKVALKVLRPELSAILGGARFLSEIKTTANLQHPHILGLFDSGEADGTVFYVMPYVEGESLRDRLRREKQLGVDDAVRIAREVASALDYAHRHNVVHRDIKPENILLHEGQALVADFGIALAASRSEGGTRMTETGMSLGTPHYMSPEQAMGEREVTPRADIYALGCVLYEMLTAEPPFTGATAQAIIARVMTEQPRSLTLQRHTIPPHIEVVVRKALEKLPADRFASAAEFAEALAKPGLVGLPDTRVAPAAVGAVRRRRWPIVVAAAAFVAIAALGAWGWLRRPPVPGVARFEMSIPDAAPLFTGTNGRDIAISPDGRRFVYVGTNRRLYVRDLDQLESRALPGTVEHTPFFSPDGQWVGFYDQPYLRKVSLAGGPPLTITSTPVLRGASWGEDGFIVYSPTTSSPLLRVPDGGGPVDTLTRLDTSRGETAHRWPTHLPEGRGILFTAYTTGTMEGAQIAVWSARTGAISRLVAGADARYVDTGHIVYVTSTGALLAVPFDLDRLAVTGNPVSLVEGVLVKSSAAGEFAISRSGTLLYLSGEGARVGLTLVTPGGTARRVIEDVTDGYAPRFSPDGRRIALRASREGGQEIWVYDAGTATLSRLTFQGGTDYPVWSPRGDTVYYSAAGSGTNRDLYRRAADGSGVADTVLARPGEQWEIAIAPNGEHALVREIGAATGADLLVLPLRPRGELRPWVQTPFAERSASIAPDSRWAAYVSNESGPDEVYVRAFPEPSGRWQVSTGGGSEPLWSRDGRTIYYRRADTLYAVSVTTRTTFATGPRRAVLAGPYQVNGNHTNYDRNPRTGEFVFLGQTQSATLRPIVVLNWFAELRARAGTGR